MFGDLLWELLRYLFYAVCLIAFAYLVIRAGSYAYFRTKLEYWRTFIKEFKRR